MSKTTIRRIINGLLSDSKIDKISPKYLNLTDHELSYHKSRILNEGQHYDRLKFMLRDNNYMLKYTDKEISDIFIRSHLDVYGYNKGNKKQYILRDGYRAMLSSYMIWVLMMTSTMGVDPSMFLCGIPISLSLGYVFYRLELNCLNKTIDDYSYALSYTLKKKERLQ